MRRKLQLAIILLYLAGCSCFLVATIISLILHFAER
jgi:hypothetical protein